MTGRRVGVELVAGGFVRFLLFRLPSACGSLAEWSPFAGLCFSCSFCCHTAVVSKMSCSGGHATGGRLDHPPHGSQLSDPFQSRDGSCAWISSSVGLQTALNAALFWRSFAECIICCLATWPWAREAPNGSHADASSGQRRLASA